MTITTKPTSKPSLRQAMSGLHTWVGLLPSWLLYFMFITGSAGYFNTEISQWMQPEIPAAVAAPSQSKMLALAEQRLQSVAPNVHEWMIRFPDERDDFLDISWEAIIDGEEVDGSEELNPQTGLPLVYLNGATQPRETSGGGVLYAMHYNLRYLPENIADYTVIAISFLMLMGLLTGIVVHKKIFREFFTFRPHKGQRSWLDMHNMLSVLSFPFQLMITYSGLLFYATTVMQGISLAPFVIMGVDPLDRNSEHSQAVIKVYSEEMLNIYRHKEAANSIVPLLPLNTILADVTARWPDETLDYMVVDNPGDANAEVTAYFTNGVATLNRKAAYDGVNGELLRSPRKTKPDRVIDRGLRGLHEGRFSPLGLRWLYFISGLMGAGMIATGAILWAVKRRKNAEELAKKTGQLPIGLRLVENLNVGTLVGLPAAIAVYFWANRLLPVGMEARAEWEMHSLFIAWGLLSVVVMFRPIKRAWIETLSFAALAYGLLPILNMLTTDRHLGVSLVQGDWLMAGFDISMLVFGVIFALVAIRLQRQQNRVALSPKSEINHPLVEVITP